MQHENLNRRMSSLLPGNPLVRAGGSTNKPGVVPPVAMIVRSLVVILGSVVAMRKRFLQYNKRFRTINQTAEH